MALKAFMSLVEGKNEAPFSMCIFEDHHQILAGLVDASQVGTQSPALLDSLLLLGWAALTWNRGYNEPSADDGFFDYLHRLNAVSSNSPFANLRYQYHLFSSVILHSHSSSEVRLAYISDTLLHCPYQNLQVVAVDWLRSEIANAFNLNPSVDFKFTRLFQCSTRSPEHGDNVFATPSALSSVAPHLFAPPTIANDSEIRFKAQFWLAALNLLYFVYSSPSMSESLAIRQLSDIHKIQPRFLDRLESIVLATMSPELDEHKGERAVPLADAYAIEDGLNRVKRALADFS